MFVCPRTCFSLSNRCSAIKPWVHYVPVSVDLADVKELLEFFQKHDDVAKRIADNGFDFIWRHLRMEDAQEYWTVLLQEYTKLIKWKVERNASLILVNEKTNL